MNEDKSTDGVQEEKGKPEEKEQASETTEQADDGVVELDVTKKYHSKRRPDYHVSGDKIWEGFMRGQRYDKLQSEHMKLQTQREADTDKLAVQAERIAQLESNERLVKSMQAVGLGATGQKPVAAVEPAEDWLTFGEEPTAPLQNAYVNPNELASRVDNVVKTEMDSRLKPEAMRQWVKEDVADLYSIEREKQEGQLAIGRADQKIRSARLAELKMSLPDINEEALTSIVDADAEYIRHALDASELIRQGDTQAGIETFMDGLDKSRSVKQKELDLMQQQSKITAEREREAEVEAFSAGSLPGEEPAEDRERRYDWHEAEKAQVANMEEIHKQMDRLKTLKNTGMT